MTDQPVLFEKAGDHVAMVAINRPEARNAVNAAVAAGIEDALKTTEADPDIWAVVLTGTGDKAFSAGADLKAISAGDGAALNTKDGGFGGLTQAKRKKLWIAAVNGAALAGGCELVLSCDLVVAEEHATFGLPEVKRGLVALAGGVFRLPRALPKAIAMEMIATGGPISAERAERFGLVNRVTPTGQARAAAIAFAEEICANAPLCVQESLTLARQAYDFEEETLWRLSGEAGRRIFGSEDFQEGPRAFIEKRAPQWKGR